MKVVKMEEFEVSGLMKMKGFCKNWIWSFHVWWVSSTCGGYYNFFSYKPLSTYPFHCLPWFNVVLHFFFIFFNEWLRITVLMFNAFANYSINIFFGTYNFKSSFLITIQAKWQKPYKMIGWSAFLPLTFPLPI